MGLEEPVLDAIAGFQAQPLGGACGKLKTCRDVTVRADDILR
jgi:hypothetical protein